jgi:type IV pilus assembly protein PilC
MPKRNAPNKAVAAIIDVLDDIVPFLFKKRKAEIRRRQAVIDARSATVKTTKTKKRAASKKKTAGKAKRPARLPAATLEARKTADAPVAESASEPVPTVAATPVAEKKLKGRFLLADDESKTDAKAVKAGLLSEADDDSFLSKVALKDGEKTDTKKMSGWSLLAGRFFGKADSKDEKTAVPAKETQSAMSEKDMAQDSFLQRVEKKDTNAVVGTAVDSDEAGALEELASAPRGKIRPAKEEPKGRILAAADLRKETKEAKEAALRLEREVKEIKEEMKQSQKAGAPARENNDQKQAEEKKPEEKPVPHLKKNNVKKNGFQQFLSGIGYIGLGKERLQFIQNLATMLNAGLPLVDAIKTLQAETKAKPMKKMLQRITDMVDNGSPLWRAMDAQSFFSPHAIALVRIGEEAGNLAGNMTYLAAQDEKDHDLKSKVKMAMIYPSIVLTIMAVIVVVLGMFVLPNLIGVLTSLNVELPLTTRIVIKVSNAFTEYGAIGIPVGIVGLIILLILNRYTSLKIVIQWLTFRVPGVGRLAREATIARFGVILGGLLKAGVPVTDAMRSLTEVTSIVAYRKLYSRMLDHITVGDSFAKSFSAIKGSGKLLPPSVQQLVITGEKSGALADIMLKIADIYDKKASETAQKLPVILEPMLLLFIGSLVGTIAFSILVPIYSIVGNVGR